MTSKAKEAKRLKELLEAGFLQQEEYEDRIAELQGRSPSPQSSSYFVPSPSLSPDDVGDVAATTQQLPSFAVASAVARRTAVEYAVKPAPPTAAQQSGFLRSRCVRVFVSSTLLDMGSEREALQKFVFPELRRLCAARAVSFSEVDNRWGITEEDSAGGRVISLCLGQIDACRPYLLGLLGNRYGWSRRSSAFEDRRLDESLAIATAEHPWVSAYAERSITELEMLYGALFFPQQATGAAFYIRRDGNGASASAAPLLRTGGDQESPAARQMVEDLKERIRASGLPARDFASTEELCRMVLQDFSAFIDRDFPADTALADPAVRTAQLHSAFAEARSRVYVGRPEYFDALSKHLKDSSRTPLFVTGNSGAGKTALLASWIAGMSKSKPANVDLVLAHFGELSEPALANLIRFILLSLQKHFGIETEIPADPLTVVHELPHWLRVASHKLEREMRMVLVLDGLDYVEEKAHALMWLPEALPSQIRVVVSAPENSGIARILAARKCVQLRIEPLNNVEKRQLIGDYLAQLGKRLSDSQVSMLASSPLTNLPVFLCTVLEQLRMRGNFLELSSLIQGYLACGDARALFDMILGAWEKDFGRDLVSKTMGLLYVSKSGLQDRELSETVGVKTALQWALFKSALQWALLDKNGLLHFSHLYLRKAVKQRYVSDDESRKQLSKQLAAYFERQPLDARKLFEYPHHLEVIGDSAAMHKFLGDLDVFLALYTETQKYEFLRFCKLAGDSKALAAVYRRAFDQMPEEQQGSARDRLVRLSQFHADVGDHHAAVQLMQKALEATRLASGGPSAESRDVADVLHMLGHLLLQAGRVTEAQKVSQDAYDMRIRVKSGRLHVAESLWLLALLHKKAGNYPAAVNLYKQALDITQRKLGHNHPAVSECLLTIADVYRKQASYESAQELYEEALGIATNVLGEVHPQTAEILHALGRIFEKKGVYGEALSRFTRAMEIMRNVHGEEHAAFAEICVSCAHIHRKTADYERAMELYRKALAIYESVFGHTHPDVAECLNALGLVHFARGELDEAEDVLHRAISTLEAVYGPDHVNLARFAANLADVLAGKARYEEAIALYNRALDINTKTLGEDHPETAEVLSSLGFIAKKRGNFTEAETLYRRSLAVIEKVFGSSHYKVAILLQNIGVTSRKLGKLDEAWDCYSRALALNETLLGASHPSTGDNLNGLGLVERKRGNLDEAADFHRRALELFESRFGRSHAKVALTLNYLAEVYRKQGRFSFLDGTEALYLRALEINRHVYGEEHPEVAENLNGLATLYKNQFNFEKAEAMYERAIAMSERLLGKTNPHVHNRMKNLADLYDRWGSVAKAERVREMIAQRWGPK